MKKVLKWSGITLAILVIILAVTPYLFKDKIQSMIAKTINENINATVTFDNVGLSLFRNFPKASLTIDELTIVNEAPFKGDTLFYAEKINLKMSIGELFKDASETLDVHSISTISSNLNIRINKKGVGSFDIAKKAEINTTDTIENTPFSLSIQEYNIQNLQLSFTDEASKMKLLLKDLHHSGKGDFTSEVLDLKTTTKTLVSVNLDGTNYMQNVSLSLDAILGINLKNNTYSFKDNKAFINQLPLEFNGFVQLVENGQLFELTFNTPTSSFKNMLALVPEQYSGNLNKVKTSGDFNLKGTVNGILSEKTIPKFDINIASSNAMFKYDALPKAVKNIHINTQISNSTGTINDTKININTFSFTIDKDVFETNGKIYNISKNPTFQLSAKGTIDLGNISKVYPIALEKNISGILRANISTSFDMKSVEKGNYERIKNKGELSLKGFTYAGNELANTFIIDKTSVTFNPNQIKLTAFDARTGDSDIHVTGNLENFYGFLFKKQELKGEFVMHSDFLKITDFMTSVIDSVETTNSSSNTSVKIPAFLNCSLTATAKKVIYDNLTLSNVSGALFIKNEAVELKDLKMELFGGNISMNGSVSTKEKTPVFNMNLGLKGLNISDSFTQ
ncbi:MAG: AsmA family protein, partial [Flavobacteriaceae bacterium]|nr:AsmA family protein [Flavobacteriaceae bacterium]